MCLPTTIYQLKGLNNMKVAIVGAAGRMGQMLVKLAEADPGLEVSAKVDVAPGYDTAWPAGTEAVIDFTFHAAVPANIEKAAAEGIAYVIGTTGLTPDEQARVDACAAKIPVVQAANYSLGVNLLLDLVKKAEEGKVVVRLKGGDPFLFGRGAEEAEELRKAGAEVHVVPGVSSSISVPELAGIPVTHRDYASLVTFITGHEKADRTEDRIDWKSLVNGHGTLVILMGLGNAGNISRELVEGGMSPDMPAAVISKGSTPEQRVEVTTVSCLEATIGDKKLEAPGIMVIGEVSKLRSVLGDLK